MGHQISTQTQLIAYKSHDIQEKYHRKLFNSKKKSSRRFQQELQSICKRSSYLRYQWVHQLLEELKAKNPEQLYSDYQTTLKQNCIREGKKEKIFCPSKIQKHFISNFSKRFSDRQLSLPYELLDQAFEQCKSYFMVMSWLHKMVTLSTNDQQNKNSLLVQQWDLSQQQKIYEILLNLALKAYQKSKLFTQKMNFENIPQLLNSNLARLIKKLTTSNLKFYEKEMLIARIQQQLEMDLNSIHISVPILKKKIGQDTIYANLRTIKQVGHIDVTFLWKYFGYELF